MHVMYSFKPIDDISDTRNWTHWIPIINTGEAAMIKAAKNRKAAWATRTLKLLRNNDEITEIFVRFSRSSFALNVSLGRIGGFLWVDNNLGHDVWNQNTGGRFILTGEDSQDQFGHNYYTVREFESLGYLDNVIGLEGERILISPSPPNFLLYHSNGRRLARKSQPME